MEFSKKKAIFTIVTCSIAVLFLTAVLAIGLKSGRMDPSTGESLSGDTAIEAGSTAEESGHAYERTWDPNDISVSGLDINWVDGDVTVKVGSGSLIRITERSARPLEDDEKLDLTISGGVLKVEWNDDLLGKVIRVNLFGKDRKSLTVEVPRAIAGKMKELSCTTTSGDIRIEEDFSAKEIKLESASGRVYAAGLKGENGTLSTTSGEIGLQSVSLKEKLSVSSVSGALTLEGTAAGEAEISTTSGAVSYRGSADDLKVSTISGKVSAGLDRCPAAVSMDSVSGDLTLAIPENNGFDVDYSTISGSFRSDFPVSGAAGKSGRGLYGTGQSSFKFITTSGKMTIEKAQ